jgi:hypothetical protein
MFDHGYALIIGVSENKRPTLALPIVARDIRALDAVFTHPQRCGYAPNNVKVVTGADATANGIFAGLAWLEAKLAADTSDEQTAVIYFSGHGHREPNGDAFLLPYDVGSPFREHGVPARAFAEQIEKLRPRRLLVVLDCCRAGAMDVKDPPPEELNAAALSPTSADLDALSRGQARAVLSSSTGEQRSFIRQDGKMSVFTYHLVEALTGHADGAETGTVTVAAVMQHVESRVPATAMAEQQQDQVPVFRYAGTTFPIALVLGGNGVAKGQPAPDPFSVLVRADVDVETVKGAANNVDAVIGGNRSVNIDATAKVGTVEKDATFTNVKVTID